MLFFERLFGAYYFLFLKKRRATKKLKLFLFDRSEDSGALAMIIAVKILLIGLLLAIAIRFYKFIIPSKFITVIGFFIYGFLIIAQYKYFLSNSDRRRKIIEDFREISFKQKLFWTIISISIIIVPLFLFPIVL